MELLREVGLAAEFTNHHWISLTHKHNVCGQLHPVCDRLNIPVLCYGIRTDFRGEPFEGSKYLLAWAEQLIEIKAICKTGSKATFNARLDDRGERVLEGAQTLIGMNYEAMSRRAFNLLEATPCEYKIPPENDVDTS